MVRNFESILYTRSPAISGMRACKRVCDKLSSTRLQNYTIGASLLSIRIRIPKSNIPSINFKITRSKLI